ncbi:O-methyltransferase [Aestuariivirga sp.]|uniref:O-methyltransferase n=1 Tax=Aestuariivirga sp. TaxID=2650926 RepID=UPI0025B80177|nr:O-methyltransferase [Aestuariivirga sp.]MCA3554089.1 hypothetical protein [Aestuariivirga sp.]
MSGASIPYYLRPHKSVDRRLFLDLLTRFERWKPLAEYVYVSMGAYPLEDHKLVHRHLGITRLIAFDLEELIVARQKFNKPIETCHCLHKKSGELISDLDAILSACSFPEPEGLIVWLDYTSPGQLGHQVREFEALLNKLRAGDLVRVTVNAQPSALLEPQLPGAIPLLVTDKQERQFKNLKSRIGEFLPSETSPKNMTQEGLPLAISKSFGAAALKALPVTGDNIFCPLSIIRYADGEQMLSITGAIVPRSDRSAFLERLDVQSWPFVSTDWSEVHRLLVPTLTIRERLFLEKGIMSKNPVDLVAELGFGAASDIKMDEFLECYRRYYRFYPTLLSAEI